MGGKAKNSRGHHMGGRTQEGGRVGLYFVCWVCGVVFKRRRGFKNHPHWQITRVREYLPEFPLGVDNLFDPQKQAVQ